MLQAKYKEVEDNKHTGRANQTWKFDEQIAGCIGVSQRINPAYTFDTEIDSSSSSTSASCNDDGGKSSEVNWGDDGWDVDDSDCNGKHSKTLKNRSWKQKSYSSTAEMLGFLQSYTVREKKAEEQKIKLLREMQQKRWIFQSISGCRKKK